MSKKSDFKLFLDYFPSVDLPIMLGEEEHHVFSAENEALPVPLIRDYILNILPTEDETVEIIEEDTDELVEYIACFQISNTEDYHAIVYWRADLLNYEYILATFDANGKRIDSKPIGGMRAEGQKVHQSVTQIDEDGFIIIAEGTAVYDGIDTTDFDAEEGKIRRLELRNDGVIAYMKVEI
jgi:hypothetical protein